MTDLKFELLGMFYNSPTQSKTCIQLFTVYLNRQDELVRASEDLLGLGYIRKLSNDDAYQITSSGREAYEEERRARNNAEEERNYRSFNKVQLIIVAAFAGVTAVATVVGVIISFIYR